MSINKCIIIGRIGQDPELKHLPTGNAVCNLSVATSEVYKDKNGERQESTQWHRVQVYGKQAEHCEKYLKKGSQVFIEGKVQYRSYDKDGVKQYITEIVASTVTFLDKAEKKEEATVSQTMSHEDVPF
jgi:single-strand DNA-binding protein